MKVPVIQEFSTFTLFPVCCQSFLSYLKKLLDFGNFVAVVSYSNPSLFSKEKQDWWGLFREGINNIWYPHPGHMPTQSITFLHKEMEVNKKEVKEGKCPMKTLIWIRYRGMSCFCWIKIRSNIFELERGVKGSIRLMYCQY